MKPILMFLQTTCPHCRRALAWMDEVARENPAYAAVPVEKIDERAQPKLAARYDYYYVPTYYIDGEKTHEGVASKAIIERIFAEACGAQAGKGPLGGEIDAG